ncbi:hypothetical protein ACHAWF_004025 [Thalassiosira exigua]
MARSSKAGGRDGGTILQLLTTLPICTRCIERGPIPPPPRTALIPRPTLTRRPRVRRELRGRLPLPRGRIRGRDTRGEVRCPRIGATLSAADPFRIEAAGTGEPSRGERASRLGLRKKALGLRDASSVDGRVPGRSDPLSAVVDPMDAPFASPSLTTGKKKIFRVTSDSRHM